MAYLLFPDHEVLREQAPLAKVHTYILRQLGTVGNAPGNGDLQYYYMAIGDNTTGDSFLGQACFGCVRNGGGGGPFTANSGIVGSIGADGCSATGWASSVNSSVFSRPRSMSTSAVRWM